MTTAIPAMRSASSWNGTVVNSTEIRLPSLRLAGTARTEPDWYRLLPVRTVSLKPSQCRCRKFWGMMMSSDCPTASAGAKPNIRSAPGLQNRTIPWASAYITASAMALTRVAAKRATSQSMGGRHHVARRAVDLVTFRCRSLRRCEDALGVEVFDVPALRARGRIDDTVDQGGPPGGECSVQRFREAGSVFGKITNPSKRFDHLVVASVRNEASRRRLSARLIAAVNPVVVDNQGHDWEPVSADRLELHSAESEGAVTYDGHDPSTGHSGRGDGISHADAHHTPCTAIEALARLIHVDDVASEIESIGPLVDDGNVRFIREHIANRSEGTRETHRMWIGTQLRCHAGDILLFALIHRLQPRCAWLDLTRLECGEEGGHRRFDIADDRCRDRTVTVDFRGGDVELDDLRAFIPEGRPSLRKKPVQACPDQHDDIGLANNE